MSITVSNPSGDNKTFLINFAPQGLNYGSLPNGIYDLSLQGNLLQDMGGGYTTSDCTWTFHRLVADYDGNKTVGSRDGTYFNSAWQTVAGQAGYLEGMDLNSDGE